MRVVSLFSGIGALDRGLEMAGMEVVGQVEYEPFCVAALEKHWPGVARWTDVREVRADDVVARCGPVHVLAGGFPCQDVSVAGHGKGVEHGERSGLWREYDRLIRGVRPRYVIVENVPALRTRGADIVLGDLEAAGYSCWPVVVGARHVGAPHRRDRVWIIGVADAGSAGLAQRGSERGDVPEELPSPRRGCPACDVADSDGRGRQGQRQSEPAGVEGASGDIADRCDTRWPGATAWPARPGEPQHAWEEPRAVESPVGGPVDGPARRLSRWRRGALKALGNAVVPQVAAVVGLVVMEMEQRRA